MKTWISKQIGIQAMKVIIKNVPKVEALLVDFGTGLAPTTDSGQVKQALQIMPKIAREVQSVLLDIEEQIREHNLCPLSERENPTKKYDRFIPVTKQPNAKTLPKNKTERDKILTKFRLLRTTSIKQSNLINIELSLTRSIEALKHNTIAGKIELMHQEKDIKW